MGLYANTKRDGTKKITDLAKLLCRTVATFRPIILNKFKDNLPIIALIEAIDALCALLPEAEEAFMDFSGQNEPIISDPTGAPGINPDAPDAPTPDTGV